MGEKEQRVLLVPSLTAQGPQSRASALLQALRDKQGCDTQQTRFLACVRNPTLGIKTLEGIQNTRKSILTYRPGIFLSISMTVPCQIYHTIDGYPMHKM